ncbi:MAG: HAD hydrolase family protein [bacterium]|nr:HAD hydrolase family protein [bacterium]
MNTPDHRGIKLLLLDCDGVLTDGRLYFSAAGEELKVFDVQDGHGIVSWIRAGRKMGIISGRTSPIVNRRAAELGIQFVKQGVSDKLASAREIWEETGLAPSETAFVGDDLPDLELMETCALGIAVANAIAPVMELADRVTTRIGGRGAVREVIDMLMAEQ